MSKRMNVSMAVVVVVVVLGAQAAFAGVISGVNAGALSWHDLERFGPANLVGQHLGNGDWMDVAPPVEKRWLLFNLNGLVTLNNMQVLNASTVGSGRQMYTAPIQYSSDGVNWTTLEASHTFKTNAQGWDTISFGGAQARLVRIGSPTVPYTYTSYDEGRTALREVKFDGTRGTESFTEMTGVTATASSGYAGVRIASKTVDGSGLLPDEDGDGILQQDRNPSNMWQFTWGTVAGNWIQWDLGVGGKHLQNMLVWNYNNSDSGGLSNGLLSARIQYSLNGTSWTDMGTGYFNSATGPGSYQIGLGVKNDEAVTQFNFGGSLVRYVKFDNLTLLSLSPSGEGGLGEVKFYESQLPEPVAEPAALGLLLLGVPALLRRRS